MNPQDQTDDSENDAKDGSQPIPISEGEKFIDEDENANASEKSREDKKEEKKTEIKQKKYMSTSDNIAFWQLIVNIGGMAIGTGLFLLTIFTFWSAMKANAISEKNYELAKESYDSSSKKSREIFELEKANAQAQIEAMKEQVNAIKEQFRIENEPYLELVPTKLTFEVGKSIIIEFNIYNWGKYPVRVI